MSNVRCRAVLLMNIVAAAVLFWVIAGAAGQEAPSLAPGPSTAAAEAPGPSTAAAEAPGPSTAAAEAPGPSTAAAEAPGPSTVDDDCMNSLLNMSDCLTFVDGASNMTKPDAPCCPEVAGLVESKPVCLCKVLSNASSVGFNIDVKRALLLPSACSLTALPVSLCSTFGYPVAEAPVSGEAPLSPGTAPGGSAAATPAAGDDTGASANIGASSLTLLISLLLAFLTAP